MDWYYQQSRMQLKSSDGVCGCKINAVDTLMGNFSGGPWLLPAVNWRIVCPDPAFVWSGPWFTALASLSSWNLQPLDQMPAPPPTQGWQHDGDNIWWWPALIRTHDQPPGSLTSDNGHHRSAMLLLSPQADSLRAICLCINPTNKFRPPLQLIP